MRLKGFTLIYAIYIALFITLGCIATIMSVQLYQQYSYNLININEREKVIHEAFDLALHSTSSLPYDTVINYDLYNNKKHIVQIHQKHWGLFDVISVSGTSKLYPKKVACIGSLPTRFPKHALQLGSQDYPLVLTGKTTLTGIVTIGQAGIESGTFNGVSYSSDKLVNGSIQINKEGLPPMPTTRILQAFHNKGIIYSGIPSDIQENSFFEPTLLFVSDAPQILDKTKFTGNIVIISHSRVIIRQSSSLDDCIVIAPVIEIESGFKGSGQFFATDTLMVGENVSLTYPSILCVVGGKESFCQIGKQTQIDGEVYVHISGVLLRTPHLVINGAIINGFAYTNGNMIMRGNVNGAIWCEQFIELSIANIYMNYLHNAQINILNRKSNFLTSFGVEITGNQDAVVAWLK